jgi:hypothetical protein
MNSFLTLSSKSPTISLWCYPIALEIITMFLFQSYEPTEILMTLLSDYQDWLSLPHEVKFHLWNCFFCSYLRIPTVITLWKDGPVFVFIKQQKVNTKFIIPEDWPPLSWLCDSKGFVMSLIFSPILQYSFQLRQHDSHLGRFPSKVISAFTITIVAACTKISKGNSNRLMFVIHIASPGHHILDTVLLVRHFCGYDLAIHRFRGNCSAVSG